MNIALIFVSTETEAADCVQKIKDKKEKRGMEKLVIFQVGRSEAYRELGRVFTIVDAVNGIDVAKKFFDGGEKIKNFIACGPTSFIRQAQEAFKDLIVPGPTD